jgi:hypothetical protein
MASVQEMIPPPIMTHLASSSDLVAASPWLLFCVFIVLAMKKKTQLAAGGYKERSTVFWLYIALATTCILFMALVDLKT